MILKKKMLYPKYKLCFTRMFGDPRHWCEYCKYWNHDGRRFKNIVIQVDDFLHDVHDLCYKLPKLDPDSTVYLKHYVYII